MNKFAKNSATLLAAVIFICFLFFNQTVYAQEKTLKVLEAEGVIANADIGTDSCKIYLLTDDKKDLTFILTPGIDFLTKDEQKEYLDYRKTLPSKSFPTITDVGSRVRLKYIDKGSFYFVKYEVISAPKNLWITIIATVKDKSEAYKKKHEAYKQGFFPDVLASSDYPALKPGYYVVVAAVADNLFLALVNQRWLRAKGWPGAYSKKIR